MITTPRDEVATRDQSTSIATQSYCYLSIPPVFPHELRALPEMAAKRKGMANPPHRASMFIVLSLSSHRSHVVPRPIPAGSTKQIKHLSTNTHLLIQALELLRLRYTSPHA